MERKDVKGLGGERMDRKAGRECMCWKDWTVMGGWIGWQSEFVVVVWVNFCPRHVMWLLKRKFWEALGMVWCWRTRLWKWISNICVGCTARRVSGGNRDSSREKIVRSRWVGSGVGLDCEISEEEWGICEEARCWRRREGITIKRSSRPQSNRWWVAQWLP